MRLKHMLDDISDVLS